MPTPVSSLQSGVWGRFFISHWGPVSRPRFPGMMLSRLPSKKERGKRKNQKAKGKVTGVDPLDAEPVAGWQHTESVREAARSREGAKKDVTSSRDKPHP